MAAVAEPELKRPKGGHRCGAARRCKACDQGRTHDDDSRDCQHGRLSRSNLEEQAGNRAAKRQ